MDLSERDSGGPSGTGGARRTQDGTSFNHDPAPSNNQPTSLGPGHPVNTQGGRTHRDLSNDTYLLARTEAEQNRQVNIYLAKHISFFRPFSNHGPAPVQTSDLPHVVNGDRETMVSEAHRAHNSVSSSRSGPQNGEQEHHTWAPADNRSGYPHSHGAPGVRDPQPHVNGHLAHPQPQGTRAGDDPQREPMEFWGRFRRPNAGNSEHITAQGGGQDRSAPLSNGSHHPRLHGHSAPQRFFEQRSGAAAAEQAALAQRAAAREAIEQAIAEIDRLGVYKPDQKALLDQGEHMHDARGYLSSSN